MIIPGSLRIGNYVDTPNGVKRVTDISVDSKCFFISSDVKPIRLSEEWLKAFGFVDGVLEEDGFIITIVYYDCWNILYKRHEDECFLRIYPYVHEFQNLIFALSGYELIRKY